MDTFFNTPFLRKNIPTLEGINSKEGNLHMIVAPTAADKNNIRINFISQDKDGKTCGEVCTLISSETAKMLAYQLIQTFDISLTDGELEKAKRMSEEYFSQFPTAKDYKSYTPLDII